VLLASGCAKAPGEQAKAIEAESEMTSRQGDRDVIPAGFQGRWASDAVTCRDADGKGVHVITAGRISGYESDAVLLKNALMFEQSPDGKEATTLLALVAHSGEGELGIEKMRLSRAGDHLFLSPEPAEPAQHWAHPLMRCPS
jgi:hypothetical protein